MLCFSGNSIGGFSQNGLNSVATSPAYLGVFIQFAIYHILMRTNWLHSAPRPNLLFAGCLLADNHR